jgi:hypothetical protein
MAVSELAPQPVAFYALVFFLVNATYIGLIWELVKEEDVSPKVLRVLRIRSLVTLCIFGSAIGIAPGFPLIALALCIACLIDYLRPAPAEVEKASRNDCPPGTSARYMQPIRCLQTE